MKKTAIYIALIVFLFAYAHENQLKAQETPLKELKIGDVLDGRIPLQLFNHPGTKSGTIEQYRGKWLILDFWETYCMACINAMPKYQKLNEKYRDNLEIVMVTKSDPENVQSFLKRSPVTRGTDFSFIVRDSVLNKLFPHRIIPHEVWIDPDGVVRAITGGEEVNEDNINKVLLDKNYKLPIKSENRDWKKERMVDANSEDRLLFRSILKSYDPTAPRRAWFERASSTPHGDSASFHRIKHVYFSNYRPLAMFYAVYMFGCYGNSGALNPHRIVVEIKNSRMRMQYANPDLKIPFFPVMPYMHYKTKEEFYQENWFSYDLTLPGYLPEKQVFNYVFEDLNHYFPIKAKIERRSVPCLVVKTEDQKYSQALLQSKNGETKSEMNDEAIIVQNYPIKELFDYYFLNFRSKPIIDETGVDYNIDIEINFKYSPYLDRTRGLVVNMLNFDEKVFREEMAKYGLQVTVESRPVDLLVIYD